MMQTTTTTLEKDHPPAQMSCLYNTMSFYNRRKQNSHRKTQKNNLIDNGTP